MKWSTSYFVHMFLIYYLDNNTCVRLYIQIRAQRRILYFLCNVRAQCYLCVTMVLTCKGFRHAQHLSRHILLLHNNMVYVCVQGGSSK